MNNGPYGAPPPLGPSGYGGPPAPYGGPPSPYGPPPADETMAWVAVACSSLSWLTCCCLPIPFVNLLGGLGGTALSIAGVICGYLAWQKAKRENARTDIAMIGLVLGAVRVGITLIGMIAMVVMLALGMSIGILEGLTQH